MTLDTTYVQRYLKEFDFESLFIEELGWDYCDDTGLNVEIDGEMFMLQAVAEKRGVVAFICDVAGAIPPYATRRRIERRVAQSFRQHFIIYVDGSRTEQVWQWVRQELGKPLASREYRYTIQQSGEPLIQKLQDIAFSFEEEESLTHIDVTSRVRAAFDVEKVTKKFYDRFKKERDAFQKFLAGIPSEELEQWYVSVMLNRLMFIYFIQKKGFLDNDPDYLRSKLIQSQLQAADRFYSDFLCPLFFEGFAKPQDERPPAIRALLGDIPYLNGGIFQRHEVERQNGWEIRIPDAAFERLFDFFDQYQWHLDDRPLRDDREINPDVLGYIFEKYINQKQMGAYYTKEDITGYISKNTIIPFLFDEARKKCRIAFEGEQSVWSLLSADPDRYIYEAVRKGTDLPLPPEIAAGIDDMSQRGLWNTPTPEEYALPTEIWRETVARRQRYEDIRNRVFLKEIRNRVFGKNSVSFTTVSFTINDFITYNLDIQQFAQDVIENCEGPELLRAFWQAINKVTVLDPTCGSGAFLFAALNILEPLYEACLNRMEAFVAELTHGDHPHKYKDFREVLEQVKRHPNQRYFIFKSIVVNNLYGVDIMAEAVEIAKLRLFLKLVAQVDKVDNIEPLPDIDFNIRAGNTLVGFTTKAELERAMKTTPDGQLKLLSPEDLATIKCIEEKAEDIDRLFEKFRTMQTADDPQAFAPQDFVETKEKLWNRLKSLEKELNRYLAREYGIDMKKPETYPKWLESHRPFHWFIEFYGILNQGGFDVIIGNPPYVEYRKVKKDYIVRGYQTESCGNLYAFVLERGFRLLKSGGRKGMIIPHSAICTDRMEPLLTAFSQNACTAWFSTYAIRPAKLFVGTDQRLAIYVIQQGGIPKACYSSRYHRWHDEFRPYLLSLVQHANASEMHFPNSIPKVYHPTENGLWAKLAGFSSLNKHLTPRKIAHVIYFHNAPRYWIRAMNFVPYFWNERDGEKISSHLKALFFTSQIDADVVVASINSSLFYWWFVLLSTCRDLTMREIKNFPVGLEQMSETAKHKLADLTDELMTDLRKHARRKETYYKTTGQVIYDEFYPKHSKPIMDEIDHVLAQHYNFTDEELDFIINYDIKYRMGRDSQEV